MIDGKKERSEEGRWEKREKTKNEKEWCGRRTRKKDDDQEEEKERRRVQGR